jgi:hypothetical protein
LANGKKPFLTGIISVFIILDISIKNIHIKKGVFNNLRKLYMHIHTSGQEIFNIGFRGYSCNWGLHMCGLYETYEERDEIIFGLFKQGFTDGDLQLYCPVERSENEFKSDFSEYCSDCASHLDNHEEMVILSAKDLYYPTGEFSPWDMDKGLNEFFKKSQENGKRNIRATAEMVWALEKIKGVENLMAYESRLNYFIPGKPWVSICLYNLNKFSGSAIMNVLRTHPFSVNQGIITQNPYYTDPDKWLAENAPEFLY